MTHRHKWRSRYGYRSLFLEVEKGSLLPRTLHPKVVLLPPLPLALPPTENGQFSSKLSNWFEKRNLPPADNGQNCLVKVRDPPACSDNKDEKASCPSTDAQQQSPPNWTKLVTIGHNWSKLVTFGQNCSKLVTIGQSWSKLVTFGQNWSKLVTIGHNWSMLVKVGQNWSE